MKKLMLAIGVLVAASAHSQVQYDPNDPNYQDPNYYAANQSSVAVQTQMAPPALPDYAQPACPAQGYIWTPGYWAWNGMNYYWVPGTWVLPPSAGMLWTPGYWSFLNGFYGWHSGYWGASVGYYGGINYGFGYFGFGFSGGRWQNGQFFYNTAVWRVNGNRFRNLYVDNNYYRGGDFNRYSFHGQGGVQHQPRPEERNNGGGNHQAPTRPQNQHEQNWGGARGQFSNPPAVHSTSGFNGRSFNATGGRVSGGGGHGRR